MKRKNIFNKLFVAGALVLGTGLMSCEDYLTVLPSDRITEDDFWKNKADLNNVRAAAYKQMATGAVTDRILFWGELRADNLSQNNMSQTNIDLLRKGVLHPTEGMFDWAPFYTGINYCNKVLEQGEKMTVPGSEVDPSFRRGDWLPIKAEMLSMRALYYFYLIRAYRNVPFVTHSISTDAEANADSRIPATHGAVILSSLIKDLEDAKGYAAEDYSNSVDRKGRFTKRSVHALLADLYLWRACLVKHVDAKEDTIVMVNEDMVADTLSQANLDEMSKADLNLVIEHCDYIMNALQKDYEEDLELHPEWADDTERNKDYPYMLFLGSKASKGVYDGIYSDIWGHKNSEVESLFELQYDGSILKNTTYNDYLSAFSSGNLSPKSMVGSPEMTSSANSNYNPSRGFGKADIRLVETFKYSPSEAQRAPFHKNIATTIIIPDLIDVVSQEDLGAIEYRNSDSQNANWPVYRLSDVMLMKAEAIARLSTKTSAVTEGEAKDLENTEVQKLIEGFNLVNSIFKRCNPGLKASNNGDAVSNRIKPAKDFVIGKTADDLVMDVYNERQREFIGEGKRWFDIVRQSEYTNNVPGTLNGFMTLSKEVKNRLRTYWAMYVPIYSEELKVNGVEYGGSLRQNPVWDRYTVK